MLKSIPVYEWNTLLHVFKCAAMLLANQSNELCQEISKIISALNSVLNEVVPLFMIRATRSFRNEYVHPVQLLRWTHSAMDHVNEFWRCFHDTRLSFIPVWLNPGSTDTEYLYSFTWYQLNFNILKESFQNEFIPVVALDRFFVRERNQAEHSPCIM